METKPPSPICRAFLVCREVTEVPRTRETTLIGLVSSLSFRHLPAALPLGFFSRWTSAHGSYVIEIQLQAPDGGIIWQEGLPKPLLMKDPLWSYDLNLRMCPVFPQQGAYDLVLLANGEEMARQQLRVHLVARCTGEASQDR
jgi:hypothetical protein